jgi:signal transduction histidine kinase
MIRFTSLRTRIIVLTAVPTAAMLGALLLVVQRTAVPTERTIREELVGAGAVAQELLNARADGLARMADIIARDPRFFATFAVPEEERGAEFTATIEAVADEFLHITDADFLEIYLTNGRLCRIERNGGPVEAIESVAIPLEVREALRGSTMEGITRDIEGLCSAIAKPVRLGRDVAAVLRLGQRLDARFAQEIRRLTGAELAFCDGDICQVETLRSLGSIAASRDRAPSTVPHADEILESDVAGETFLTLGLLLPGVDDSDAFMALLGKHKAVAIAPLRTMERSMAVIGLLGLFLILGGGAAVAVGVTRPLSHVVAAAERLEAGHYDEPLEPEGEDEVARLAQSFLNMRESLKAHVSRLEDLDQIKSDFIALAGHELRTPLTVITGFNDLISDGAFGEIPQEVKDTSEIIKQQLTRLNSQLENILDLTRFEQGSLTIQVEPTELRPLLRESIQMQARERTGRDLRIVDQISDALPMVACDPVRIQQVFTLLLDNAVRYTPDGGSVTIKVQIEDRGPRICVRDTGIGIASSQIPWIFDKFYEVKEINRHSSGNLEFGASGFGMGLALCRAILREHGSEIEVKSVVGEGSEFSFVLPVEIEAATLALAQG